MRTLEWPETGAEGCELGVLSVATAASLAGVLAGATGSCAWDSPTSIHANRAAVLIAEVVRMSASSFISGRGLWLSSVIWKGEAFPTGFLRASVTSGMLAPSPTERESLV
jgi:hypothetical protein